MTLRLDFYIDLFDDAMTAGSRPRGPEARPGEEAAGEAGGS